MLYGIGLLVDARRATLLGWLGVVGGTATTMSGVMEAHVGFTDLAMRISLSGSLLLVVWAVLVGVSLVRSSRATSIETGSPGALG